ncbi:MAG: hypothetical protein WBN22_13660 [Verrucomicrobiia bacterium]
MSMSEATAADLMKGKSEVVCETVTRQLTNWLYEVIQPHKQ